MAIPIEDTIISFGDMVKRMPEGAEKNEKKKTLKILSKILDFGLNDQKKRTSLKNTNTKSNTS